MITNTGEIYSKNIINEDNIQSNNLKSNNFNTNYIQIIDENNINNNNSLSNKSILINGEDTTQTPTIKNKTEINDGFLRLVKDIDDKTIPPDDYCNRTIINGGEITIKHKYSGESTPTQTTIQGGNITGNVIQGTQLISIYGDNIIKINSDSIQYSKTGTSTSTYYNLIKPGSNNGSVVLNDGNNVASGQYSHVEGGKAEVTNKYCEASNFGSHAEGCGTTASAEGTHAEGYDTYAIADEAHAEGCYTKATGDSAHAEGKGKRSGQTITYLIASGSQAHAEGCLTTASSKGSHAEGYETQAKKEGAHSEGYRTKATGNYSHAEGYHTTASGNNGPHAEGYYTTASADYSHAEGYYTTASANYSHSGGDHTISNTEAGTAIGQYNISGTNKLFVVGNGTNDNNRSDAFIVDTDGDTTINGKLKLGTFEIFINNGNLTIQ